MSNRTRRDPVGATRDMNDRIAAATRAANDGRSGAWAAKADPVAHASSFRTTWGRGVDSGGSLDATTDATGILIRSSGIYEVLAHHRAASVNAATCIALGGDRSELQAREGVLTWDRAAAIASFATSLYIGWLYEDDLVTAGRLDADGDVLQYGVSLGILRIRRIS